MKIKKIILPSLCIFLLVFCLSMGKVKASTNRLLSLDTDKYKASLAKAEKILKSSKLGEEKKKKLKKLIDQNQKIVNKLIDLKDRLGDKKALLADKIRTNLNNRNTYFTIEVDDFMTNEDIASLFLKVASEDKYFFYSQYGTSQITSKHDPSRQKNGKSYAESANFDVKYRASVDDEYKVRNFVKTWSKENIDPKMSDYNKVLAIHDFIVKKNSYNVGDSNNKSGGYSIYHPSSIIFGNGGVCNAYATLFDLMARENGLQTYIVTGKSAKNGEDHMWNMVKILGSWYNIDTTWDDPVVNFNKGYVENISDFVIYDYFLKSDVEISKSRSINFDPNRPKGLYNFQELKKNSTIEYVGPNYRVVN